MKQTAIDRDAFYLPQEIIGDILRRLPVKSLIRFLCVCKDWKNLIQSPSFVTDHLQYSSHKNPSLLLQCYEHLNPLHLRLNVLDCGLKVRGVQNSASNNSLKNASIVGSCNGLVCVEMYPFCQSPRSILLWNPATTSVRHVPRTITDFGEFDDCSTGFGFSLIVNDYKIVRTFAGTYGPVTRVEVFSLDRGTWKEIDIGKLKGVKLDGKKTDTANGAIFWSGLKLEGAEEEGEDQVVVIVSFDIAKEVFTVIPRPELLYNGGEKLTFFENKLAILTDVFDESISGYEDEIPPLVEWWLLDQGTCTYGETWSWTKRYASCPESCKLDSMAIWRNEIICISNSKEDVDKGRRNVLYMMNPTSKEVKRFVIPYCGSKIRIYNYVESLVSIGSIH